MTTPEKVLITGGREVGGLNAFAAGLLEGFSDHGIPGEVVAPNEIFKRWSDLRDPNVLKILSTTAVFAAPLARRAICVAHGFPRADAQGWTRMLAILASFKLATSSPEPRLVAVSDYVAAHLRGPLNLRVDAVIRNPLQACFLEPNGESSERPYLTYVGRLLPAKNVHRLLPAMCNLQKENPELRLCIIGDGPQREALQDSFGKEPGIEFTGNLDAARVRGYLRRTKIFVSGNEMEPFGITYLEALSQGCAVAMPACGGGLEIALDQINRRVHLFPLSFDCEEVTAVLRRALVSKQDFISLEAYRAEAVADAYLRVDMDLCRTRRAKQVLGKLRRRVAGARP
jgi:glycosyltransferase involved in cell wall biosynthesis